MDDPLLGFVCIVAVGLCGGLLGALFGAVVGAVTWSDGRAAGTWLGLRVAEACRAVTPLAKGAIAGGVDGFMFLGLLGVAGAVLAWWNGSLSWQNARPIGVTAVGLVGAATLFGLLAMLLVRLRTRRFAIVSSCGLVGAFLGALTRGGDLLLVGAAGGLAVGLIVALLWR